MRLGRSILELAFLILFVCSIASYVVYTVVAGHFPVR